MIRVLLPVLALLLPCFALAQAPDDPDAAPKEQIVAGLSRNDVDITTSFDGSDIIIYGAVKRETPIPYDTLDVVVTVEGPACAITIRHKERRFGIWVNTGKVSVGSAPNFYVVATTRPLDQILTPAEDDRFRISVPLAIRAYAGTSEVADVVPYTEALVRLREASGLYRLDEGAVKLAQDTLFRADAAAREPDRRVLRHADLSSARRRGDRHLPRPHRGAQGRAGTLALPAGTLPALHLWLHVAGHRGLCRLGRLGAVPAVQARLADLAAPERSHLGQISHFLIDRRALAAQEIGDGLLKALIAQPMQRMGGDRQIAPRQLVLALGAGLDAGQPLRDGPVDGAVIAQLEMQEGVILDAAPIAAVKRIGSDQVQRPGHRPPVPQRQHQRQSPRIV